jgi:hypothetical protein
MLRWFGIILMIFGVVTGAMMYYMRSIAASAPASGDTLGVFMWNVCICVPIFFAGLLAFIIGSPHKKKWEEDRDSRKKRKKRRRE